MLVSDEVFSEVPSDHRGLGLLHRGAGEWTCSKKLKQLRLAGDGPETKL